jgi:hypothetical protein
MQLTETLLLVIVSLLLGIFWRLGNIDARLRKQFPTEKERDYEWSQIDPMGHWAAHQGKETVQKDKS